MLYSGVQSFQSISNAIHQKLFSLAAKEIAQLQDRTFATQIIDLILERKSPDCWLAFLKNGYLNHAIWSKPLIDMIGHAQTIVTFGPGAFPIKPEYRLIAVTIAQNPRWCEMLSYSYFLNYVEKDELLAEYIANSEQFIRNLEPFHVDALVNLVPHLIGSILTSVAIHTEGTELDIFWSQETLKWLFFENQHAAECLKDISFEPLYEYILSIREAPQKKEVTLMAIEVEEPLSSTPMDLDDQKWGFPEELTPNDEFEHWLSKWELTLTRPSAVKEQDLLLAPLPVRFSQTQPLLQENKAEYPSKLLRRSAPK
jgi:hypothetical protein